MATNSDLPSLDQMITYLQSNGWKKQACSACSKVYIYTNDQDESLTLPRSDRFIDYEFKMRNALDLLANAANVSKSELVEIIRFSAAPHKSDAPLH